MKIILLSVVAASLLLGAASPIFALEIRVDYTHDTNNFFDPSTQFGQQARATIEAVAARYGNLISGPTLSPVRTRDDLNDQRYGFRHPGNGDLYEVSSAASSATDELIGFGVPPANEYRNGISIDEDEMLLYVGGRPLGVTATGGSASGTNFATTFEIPNSIMNRRFRNSGSPDFQPMWGGAVSFDSNTNWHSDHTTPPLVGEDLYSVALHEVGHVMGLSMQWLDFTQYQSGVRFLGPNSLAAYNADNNADATSLNLSGSFDRHWRDDTYQSYIYPQGEPNLDGTIGLESLQNLLMEPTADYTSRLELTNVDVAALEDIGWELVEYDSCDLDFDSDCDVSDLDRLMASIGMGDSSLVDRDNWLAEAATKNRFASPYLLGDANLDGSVNASDLNAVGQQWLMTPDPLIAWQSGDFDGNQIVDPGDLNVLGQNWLKSVSPQNAIGVPEPSSHWILTVLVVLATRRRFA